MWAVLFEKLPAKTAAKRDEARQNIDRRLNLKLFPGVLKLVVGQW